MPDYGSGGDITVIMNGPFAGGGGSAVAVSSFVASAHNWKGATSPYSQVVAIGGLNISAKVDIQLSADQIERLNKQRIAFTTENRGGVVTLYAVGEKPAIDCTFQVALLETVIIGDNADGVIRGNTVSTVVELTDCLPLAGGKMEGDIDMGGNELTNLRTPYNDKDAAPKDYVDKTAKEKADSAEKNANDHAEKFATTKVSEVILTAAGWSSEAPYTQTVSVDGLADNLRALVYPKFPDDSAQDAALAEETVKVSKCTREGNQMTFTCRDDKPALDIPVVVEVHV